MGYENSDNPSDKKPFYHPKSIVETTSIGTGTRVWAFSHVLEGAVIGKDCNICDQVFIENDVVIGNRVTIKSGVQLWDGIRIEDDVFIGPNATFTNDRFPRSKKYPDSWPQTIIRKGASIGANATILPGLIISENSMVGAGSVVTKNVPRNAIVVGNPARINGYVDTPQSVVETPSLDFSSKEFEQLPVKNAKIIKMPYVEDMRGSLTFGEINKHLPFQPARYFLVYDVPNFQVRGEHAHKKLNEFLICIRGTCSVALDDGQNRCEIQLNNPLIGLYVPPLTWRVHYKYSSDAILMVLASHIYDAEDYIRDYDEFVKFVRK